MKKRKNQAAEELREMLPSLLLYNGLILLSVTAIGFVWGFDFRLYTGLLAGNALMAANMLLIGVTAGAIIKTRQQKRGQFLANMSYGLRYIGIFVILALLLTFKLVSPFTAVIPMFYPRIYYTIAAMRGKYDEE